VGAFDDAFISRVHIPLYYPPLDRGQREKIWKVFVEKFEEERRDIRINYTAKEYLRSDEVLDKNWNGREIRNGETGPHSEILGCADLFLP
jgi:hypothetical protein